MKSKCSTVLLALLAVLAFGALTAASASAETQPEFRNVGTKGDKFTGSSGEVVWETSFGFVKCTKTSVKGEIPGTKELGTKVLSNVVVNFEHCNEAFLCFNHLTWETKSLGGTLGYINKKENWVGLLLQPASGPFAECEANITGSIIGEIEPVNSNTTKYHLKYSFTKEKQLPSKFEGEGATHQLEREKRPVVLQSSSLESNEIKLTFEHAVEIH